MSQPYTPGPRQANHIKSNTLSGAEIPHDYGVAAAPHFSRIDDHSKQLLQLFNHMQDLNSRLANVACRFFGPYPTQDFGVDGGTEPGPCLDSFEHHTAHLRSEVRRLEETVEKLESL